MPAKIETFHYQFNDVIMMGRRPQNRAHTVWYVQCPFCEGEHIFSKLGRKIWVAHCVLEDIEWTITPAEYYLKKPADFSKILGDV